MNMIMNTNRLFILGLCLLCLIIYFNSLNNDFVLDDPFLITDNPFIKSSKFLPHIFKNSIYRYARRIYKPINQMYRPLQVLSYSFDYKIWKLNPFGFHLTNTLLHLLNSILIYYLLGAIFNDALSKIVSVLFLVHPINTSVVSYISGRADLLACFFILLSIILFLKFISLNLKVYYGLSLFFAALALLSRENALVLFMFIALILFIIKSKPKYYLYVIPFLLLNLFYLWLRFIIFGQDALALYLSLPFRIINFLNIIPRYLSILILPLDLHLYRTTSFITNLLNIRIFFITLFILSLTIVIIKFYKNRLLLFSIFWFMIGIVPIFILIDNYPIGGVMMAESWLYIPSMGFYIAFSYILMKLKNLGRILIICFIVFYGFLVIVNNIYWKNELILHKNILENTPEKNYLRINLITYYLKHGLLEDAFVEINKFSLYYQDSPYLYYLLGHYYGMKGELNEAINNYNIALSKEKNFFSVYYYLSFCYEELKQLDKAIDSALECFSINPYYLPNLIRIGDLYKQKGQIIEARIYYNKALEIEPDNQLIKEEIKSLN